MSDGGIMIFTFHSKTAKYIQIYEKIVALIRTKQLRENEKLPSIRVLAEQLQVSRNTTLEAYEILLAEGYIRAEQKKGYYVNPLEFIYIQKTEVFTQPYVEESSIDIDFRVGAVDQRHFPYTVWQKYSKEVLKQSKSYTYGEVFGERELIVQLRQYLFQARGIQTTEQAIVIGSSTQQLLLQLSFLLKKRFDRILLEDPGYEGVRHVFELQGFQFDTVDATKDGLTLQQLATKIAKLMYVTPSHQYPFGSALSIQQRLTLIEWACNNKGYIIEDDYDGEFRYEQKPFPALASLNPQCTIYMGTFSKSFLPGIRLAYMVLPPDLIDSYKEIFQHFENTASKIHQLTMAKLMAGGEWSKHIRRMRKIYREKMAVLKECLISELPHSVVYGEQAGLYVLIKMPSNMKNLIEKAHEKGVNVQCVDNLFQQKTEKNYFLVGFANCTLEEIRQGVQRLAIAWEES